MALVLLDLNLVVKDDNGNRAMGFEPLRFAFAPGVIKQEEVSLTGSAFTALAPPTGTKGVLIDVPDTAVSLTLKGVTGDGGTTLTPSSNALGIPLVMPLGSSPDIGILNGSATAATVQVYWL